MKSSPTIKFQSQNVSPAQKLSRQKSVRLQNAAGIQSLMQKIGVALNSPESSPDKPIKLKTEMSDILKQLPSPVRQYNQGISQMYTYSKAGMKCLQTRILPKMNEI